MHRNSAGGIRMILNLQETGPSVSAFRGPAGRKRLIPIVRRLFRLRKIIEKYTIPPFESKAFFAFLKRRISTFIIRIQKSMGCFAPVHPLDAL